MIVFWNLFLWMKEFLVSARGDERANIMEVDFQKMVEVLHEPLS